MSGRQDSNLRPPGPKPGALPGCATPRCKTSSLKSRGDRIRTCGRLVPNQERYRAALHPALYPFLFCVCKGNIFILCDQIKSLLFILCDQIKSLLFILCSNKKGYIFYVAPLLSFIKNMLLFNNSLFNKNLF